MASSDPKGAVSASTRNSPGAPAESAVQRRTVRETGRVSDWVHTRPTTGAHAAGDRSWRVPPGTTPSRGPERVRRRARPAPLPRQGPAAGTRSPVLGRPPRAPRSHPVKPGATALGVGEGTTATGKPSRAPRATGPDEERRTNAGPRGTPHTHAAGHNRGTRTGAKPQQPPGAANPGSAHNTRRTAAEDNVPRTAGPPRPHIAPTTVGTVGSGPRPHAQKDEKSGMGERLTPDAPHPGERHPPPRAPSCRPHSAQVQLARVRAVGWVTSPHTRTPRTHSQSVVGPGCTPERTSDRGWECARPRTPHTQARGAPQTHCHAPPNSSKARAVGLVTGAYARTPRTHSQWVVGPGRTPERTRGWGWESARPRTPHTQARGAPPGYPHAAPTDRKASS